MAFDLHVEAEKGCEQVERKGAVLSKITEVAASRSVWLKVKV